MGTTIALWNVVGKAVQVFLETVIPLQRHFHANAIFLAGEIAHFIVNWVFVAVEVFHKRLNTTFVLKVILLVVTLVEQMNRHARVQERQLTQTLSQDLVLEFDIGEDGWAGPETHLSTGGIGITDHRQRRYRLTQMVFLGVHFAFTADHQLQLIRQGVNHRYPYPVQTTGHFIGVIVKLTTGVQYGHDHFGR